MSSIEKNDSGVKQIIFVVETNEKNRSDTRYIIKLWNQLYGINNNDLKRQFVYMDGKFKYNKNNVKSKIKTFISENKDGENYVVYCFDTDKIDASNEELNNVKTFKKYCDDNNYKFVWFCYNIEMVFIGRSVPDFEKEKESKKFAKSPLPIDVEKLKNGNEVEDMHKRKSNIYSVLKTIHKID